MTDFTSTWYSLYDVESVLRIVTGFLFEYPMTLVVMWVLSSGVILGLVIQDYSEHNPNGFLAGLALAAVGPPLGLVLVVAVLVVVAAHILGILAAAVGLCCGVLLTNRK